MIKIKKVISFFKFCLFEDDTSAVFGLDRDKFSAESRMKFFCFYLAIRIFFIDFQIIFGCRTTIFSCIFYMFAGSFNRFNYRS